MDATRTVRAQAELGIVIVTWNNAAVIADCLGSIAREVQASGLQSHVLLVDNASSDGTPALVRAHYPWVQVIALSENIGFARANNLAMSQTATPAVLLLNPDTVLLPGALTALWSTLWAAPHIGVVGPLLLNPDGSLQSAGYRFPGIVQNLFDFFPIHPRLVGSGLNGRFGPGDGVTPFAVDHPLGACMLVRRAVIEQVGLLDEGYFYYCEEIDWCRRIRAAGWTILTAPTARVVHVGGWSSRQLPSASMLQLHRSRARYFRRWHGRWFVRLLSLLAALAAVWAQVRAALSPHDPAQQARVQVMRDVVRIYRCAAQVSGND